MTENIFKADLHVHSCHSRTKHLPALSPLDSYSKPRSIYDIAKARGMNLVTITDHDSISGCLELLDESPDLADFIISEEVTARVPELSLTIHVGVFDIKPQQHQEIQSLRHNAVELVEYLRQNRILFAVNHLFHEFRRLEQLGDYMRYIGALFNVFETQNGSMSRQHNELVAWLAPAIVGSGNDFAVIGGSDAHTLRRVGTTYTASKATNKAEFLEDIRCGRTFVGGRHAGHWTIALDVYGVILRYYPYILTRRLRNMTPAVQLRNAVFSLLLSPLFFIPFIATMRYRRQQRRCLGRISRLLGDMPPASRP